MLISHFQYKVHASNVTKSHEAEPARTLGPLVLQDYNIVDATKFNEVGLELC